MAEPSPTKESSSLRRSDISLLRSGPPKLSNPFTFPRGDVTIKVTVYGDMIEGKVVSGAMSLASPVCPIPEMLEWIFGVTVDWSCLYRSGMRSSIRPGPVQVVTRSRKLISVMMIARLS